MAKVRNVAPRLGCGASDKCPIAPELINPANEAVRKAYIGQPGNWRSRPMLTFILGHRGSNTGQGRGWSAAPVRHGVSVIRSGQRHTLGLLFHDAA